MHSNPNSSLTLLLQSESKHETFVKAATRLFIQHSQLTVEKYDSFLLSLLTDWIADEINDYFNNTINSHPYTFMDQQAIAFYANKEQESQLKKADLKLPEGFEYRELKVEEAKAIVDEVVSVKSEKELEIVR